MMKKVFTIAMEPKKTFGALAGSLFVIGALSFGFCSCSDDDGDWDPMKWKTSVQTGKDGVIAVESDGGTFEFQCKNYSPWMSSVKIQETGKAEQTFYPSDDGRYADQNLYIDATGVWARCQGNTLKVTISPSTSQNVRTLTVNVTAGDVFDSFTFRQQGTPEN